MANTTLADLIGPEIHLLFDTLDIESNWFLQPVVTWPRSDDYSKALDYIRNAKVVNDIAERGVKMITEFANIITIKDSTSFKLWNISTRDLLASRSKLRINECEVPL